MADSTRRSGRATKGQHSRALEEAENVPTPPKKGGKGSKSKKNEPTPPEEEEEGPAIIRCICGYVEEDEDDERKMICCEQCEAWQHNECMEMSENDDELPDKYYCEQCRPKDHKELLAKIALGQKPWEERARQRELEEQERKGRKKKGKKGGRKSRVSEIRKEDTLENGAMDTSPDTNHVEPPAETVQPPQEVEGSKRKLPEDGEIESKSPSQAEPVSKSRKISTPATEKPSLPPPSRRKSSAPVPSKRESTGMVLQTELVDKISDLQSEDRKRVATALVKMFVDQTKQAEKQQAFSLPPGQKVDAFGLRLGLAVEYAVYLNFWGQSGKPSEQYTDKFRAILYNVKANPELRNRLLSGSLPPNDFSKMSRDDMASKELQEKKAEMMKEAEKQHTLIQEEGPRMRRTHKGEELIEDESHMADVTDSAFSAPVIRKRASQIDTSVKQASPEAPSAQSPGAVELPETLGAGSPIVDQPLKVDTTVTAQPSPPAPDRKPSNNNFNIQDVWSGVKGPDPDAQRSRQMSRPSESAATPVQQTPGAGVKADAEIDQLLKDEEPEDEEPYSPVDYPDHPVEPGAPVWHGKMAMAGIASFNGSGKYVAGADLSSHLPWNTLIPSSLIVEGRIDIERASDYLCGLRWSSTTDVVVVSVIPSEDSENTAQFDKLFRYFTERKRYGVISKSAVSSVKDTYIIPLEAGVSKKPDFVELLEHCDIEDPTPERMLLLTFVVKGNNSPTTAQTPRGLDTSTIVSPIAANHGPNPLGQHPGFQNSPTPAMPFPPPNGQYLPPYSHSPSQAQDAYMPPHPNQQHQSQYPAQQPPVNNSGVTGMEAAKLALGENAKAPVVSELLAESPNLGEPEFAIINEFFHSVPATRNDLGLLKGMLSIRHREAGNQQNGVQ
ncbi:Transcription factor bye1 [Lecanora helva]